MDEKTAELRDIFLETTGAETVTERQEESRGSLAEGDDPTDRVRELVTTMRERYGFETALDDDELVELVCRFHDGDDDGELAAALDVYPRAVFHARMDLHLLRDSDRDAPFDLATLRRRLREAGGNDEEEESLAAALGTDAATVARYRRVVEAAAASTRANDRFRDEFAELLTDADLSGRFVRDAREDGLREATEDMETDVSF